MPLPCTKLAAGPAAAATHCLPGDKGIRIVTKAISKVTIATRAMLHNMLMRYCSVLMHVHVPSSTVFR